MKAITTRYVGATAHRPARILATDLDGNRAVLPAEGDYPYDTVHRAAAVRLCESMGWPGAETLVGGSIKYGMAWVFAPAPAAPPPADRIEYAKVVWDVEDVKVLRPAWTDAQAHAFLARNADPLRDQLIERGWDVLGDLIGADEAEQAAGEAR